MRMRKKLAVAFSQEDSMLKFQTRIEEIFAETESYSEAIAAYCEEYDLDVTEIVELISPALREKLFREGVKNRRVKSDRNELEEGFY